MHRNFSRTVDIQTGVVRGNLGRAREAANWLLDPANQTVFSGSAQSYQAEMVARAALISEATDLNMVASEAGHLAASCGNCHQAVGGGPNFVVGSEAPGGDSREGHMIRHIWAIDRMWEGLVGPSDDAWRAGAEALALTGPADRESFRSSLPAEDLARYLGRVENLAGTAMNTTASSDRAQIYGQVLGTCIGCHGS
jgi:cytochrome c553